MPHILIVEDNEGLAATIRDMLTGDRHTVELAHTISDAKLRLKLGNFDLVVLDWNLPDGEGIEICRLIRSQKEKTPVLMLTAKADVNSKVESLDAGADDYVVKPFSVLELSARVRALLRRASDSTQDQLELGVLILDNLNFRVTASGEEIMFRPREFAILEFLMRHPNQPFSPERIMSHVWTTESESTPDVVRVHINKIRKKLSKSNIEDPIIETVPGLGYRLRSASATDK